jgi:hypothetical protein
LNDLRLRSTLAEAEALRRGRFDPSRLAADFKASAYVSLAAILEFAIREIGPEVRAEVLRACPHPELLRAELAAIAAHRSFASASNSNRTGLIERVRLSKGPTLSTDDWTDDILFADGRTVDGTSFDALWGVLGLPGDSLPSTGHRLALGEIKDLRNRIAHGEDEAARVGASKTFHELFLRISQVEDVLERLDASLDTWIADRAWGP